MSITDAATGQNQKGNRDMAYDGLNRLASVSAPDLFGTASYAYDVQDNLKHVQVTAGSQPRNVDYCYDAANRLTNITSASATYCGGATVTGLGYDVQGNLANKSGVLYAFDQGNRLRSVNGGALGAYLYDGHGRRVQDTVGGVAKRSQYTLSGQLVMTGDDRAGKVREYIALGGSLVLIRERDVATGAYTMLYQHTDALGTPVAITNSAKTVIERREYEPYGYQTSPTLADGPNYTGHVADAATGLVYMQQRYYDPLCGCFVSSDPVPALKGSFNRYWYANSNPYTNHDPDGRVCVGQASGYCDRSAHYDQLDKKYSGGGTNTTYFGAISDMTENLANMDLPGGKTIAGVSAQADKFLNTLSQGIEKFTDGQAAKIDSGQIKETGRSLDLRLVKDEQSFIQKSLNGLQSSNPGLYHDVISTMNANANRSDAFGLINSITDPNIAAAAASTRLELGRPIDFANEADRNVMGKFMTEIRRDSK